MLINIAVKEAKYSRCSKCGSVFDENGRTVPIDELSKIPKQNIKPTVCKGCSDYETWEYEKYFANSCTGRDSNPR